MKSTKNSHSHVILQRILTDARLMNHDTKNFVTLQKLKYVSFLLHHSTFLKSKVHLITGHEGPRGERRYHSSNLCETHLIVVHNTTTDINAAINHNKFY